jgi:hypothetical protein
MARIFSTQESLSEADAWSALCAGDSLQLEAGALHLCYHGDELSRISARFFELLTKEQQPGSRAVLLHALFLLARVRGHLDLPRAFGAALKNLDDDDGDVRAAAAMLLGEALSGACGRAHLLETWSLPTEVALQVQALVTFQVRFETAAARDDVSGCRVLCQAAAHSASSALRGQAILAALLVFDADGARDDQGLAQLLALMCDDPSLFVRDVHRDARASLVDFGS